MSLKQQDIFLQAMEFIIDAVALSTEGESRADVGRFKDMLKILARCRYIRQRH